MSGLERYRHSTIQGHHQEPTTTPCNTNKVTVIVLCSSGHRQQPQFENSLRHISPLKGPPSLPQWKRRSHPYTNDGGEKRERSTRSKKDIETNPSARRLFIHPSHPSHPLISPIPPLPLRNSQCFGRSIEVRPRRAPKVRNLHLDYPIQLLHFGGADACEGLQLGAREADGHVVGDARPQGHRELVFLGNLARVESPKRGLDSLAGDEAVGDVFGCALLPPVHRARHSAARDQSGPCEVYGHAEGHHAGGERDGHEGGEGKRRAEAKHALAVARVDVVDDLDVHVQ